MEHQVVTVLRAQFCISSIIYLQFYILMLTKIENAYKLKQYIFIV